MIYSLPVPPSRTAVAAMIRDAMRTHEPVEPTIDPNNGHEWIDLPHDPFDFHDGKWHTMLVVGEQVTVTSAFGPQQRIVTYVDGVKRRVQLKSV